MENKVLSIFDQMNFKESIRQNHGTPQQNFRNTFPSASDDAIDLMIRLLEFDPAKRITAQEALSHPYIAQFHDPSVERDATFKVRVDVDDDEKRPTAFYRDELYKLVNAGKRGDQQSDRPGKMRGDTYGASQNAHRGSQNSGRNR